ncbi:MAG: hypothetical protein WCP22_01045 [Chlamydiota bacterium]
MISAAGRLVTRLFDALLYPFRDAAPVWGLAFAAFLTAAGVILAYRLVSDQDAIRRARKRIQGHLLGIYLYRDEPAAMLASLAGVWGESLRYVGRALVPLAVAIVPVALVCVQLDLRYAHRPLMPGEASIVSVELGPGADTRTARAALAVTDGLKTETSPVRIGDREIDWRVRATGVGAQAVTVTVNGAAVEKDIRVGAGVACIYPESARPSMRRAFLFPGGETIGRGSPVSVLRVDYPSRTIRMAGMRLHWSVAYFLLALIFGAALGKMMGIEY